MPASMTYDSLVDDIKKYCERPNDANLAAQIPRLVMMAENRIATDLRILGLREVAAGTLQTGERALPKPAYWRRTETFSYTAAGLKVPLLLRSLGFCESFWPDVAATAAPRYYADYNFDNFLLAATPDQNYPFELTYVARLSPLDTASQENWYTGNAPQLLLYASLTEAGVFLRNGAMTALYKGLYDESRASFKTEDAVRQVDDNIVVGVA